MHRHSRVRLIVGGLIIDQYGLSVNNRDIGQLETRGAVHRHSFIIQRFQNHGKLITPSEISMRLRKKKVQKNILSFCLLVKMKQKEKKIYIKGFKLHVKKKAEEKNERKRLSMLHLFEFQSG